MVLPQVRPTPSWIESGAKLIRGLDLLGLRLSAQVVGNSLLNGVTTITPSVRYLSFRAWITHVYIQQGMPDELRAFRDFASRVEAALGLGNLLVDPLTLRDVEYVVVPQYRTTPDRPSNASRAVSTIRQSISQRLARQDDTAQSDNKTVEQPAATWRLLLV